MNRSNPPKLPTTSPSPLVPKGVKQASGARRVSQAVVYHDETRNIPRSIQRSPCLDFGRCRGDFISRMSAAN
ncbi:MAG: hypothetical protein P8J33_10010 [Pirellulaceae bacterium]|nr:hypothetical protein [Pirellulaceae bacterium]